MNSVVAGVIAALAIFATFMAEMLCREGVCIENFSAPVVPCRCPQQDFCGEKVIQVNFISFLETWKFVDGFSHVFL